MASVEEIQIPDVKKVLGTPKITFVLGGPASGKGTQCTKLVEEFGYTHISTGDLFRTEVAKGSREGEMMKRIMNEGGLIPYQLTVQVLVNALIASPSKNYLIDGFPRAKDQAIYFEQVVGEAQAVLYYNLEHDAMVARCMERAQTSGRTDDTQEVIEARLKTYEDQSKPVIDMYSKFGKVREIDASGDKLNVWNKTRTAMLPQISFMVGPMCSGKSQLGKALCERTNAKSINFGKFIADHNLEDHDVDDQCMSLIQHLAQEISPRVILEDFPRTLYQAKFFMKNACEAKNVFVLSCSKDLSQERMLSFVDTDKYMPSSLLSKRIGQYNQDMVELLPFLRDFTNCSEISTDAAFKVSFKNICAQVEPIIVSVRASGSKEATSAKNDILAGLQKEKYIALEVNDLIQLEVQRQTEVGLAIQELLNDGKNVWSEPAHIVTILKRIIFSGIDCNDKFLLIGFPDQIEHAQIFEEQCSNITAMVYTSDKAHPTVEIKGDDLSLKCLDSMFAKQFRLRTMNEWDANTFEDCLGKKVQWGIVSGRPCSNKEETAKALAALCKGKVINMKAIGEELRKKMGTEDEPFEGDVPTDRIEEFILEIVSKDRQCNEKYCYIFEDWAHKNATDFVNAIDGEFGLPNFCIQTKCDKKTIEDRYKKANETEEIGEDAAAELEEQAKKDDANCADFVNIFKDCNISAKYHEVSTETVEGANNALRSAFSAKVILVNHEKRLDVDTVCSNLSIKYNMLYMSVYQLIRQHIGEATPMGKALLASKKVKNLNDNARLPDGDADEYEEDMYSAVHFDSKLVMKMLQQTLIEKRTDQKHILLEGFCNSKKLEDDKDKFVVRSMDELFMIEKGLGEIVGCISLQGKLEQSEYVADRWEKFEKAAVVEKKKEQVLDDDGNLVDAPVDAPADDDGAEKEAPKFNPADFEWTITNKVSKNMPQLFRDFKGANCVCEEKASQGFNEVQGEAITKSLDEFCARLHAENTDSKYIYQQVVFQE